MTGWLNVIDFNKKTGLIAGRISAGMKKAGRVTEIGDILIAACCLEHSLPLATGNRKHFEPIKGLELVEI